MTTLKLNTGIENLHESKIQAFVCVKKAHDNFIAFRVYVLEAQALHHVKLVTSCKLYCDACEQIF